MTLKCPTILYQTVLLANKQWSMTGFQFEQTGGKLGGLCFPRMTEKAYAELSN